MALVAVLLAAVWFLYLVVESFQPHVPKHEQIIEIIPDETSGGVEGGSPTDSLKLEGTGPERADATPGQSIADERPEVEEVLKDVSLESSSSDAAGTVTSGSSDQLQLDVAPVASFKGGKSLGTGTRPALGAATDRKGAGLGSNGGTSSSPNRAPSINTPGSSIISASSWGRSWTTTPWPTSRELSSQKPVVRRAASGEGEKRLFFTWQGGKRRQADVEFFTKAGGRHRAGYDHFSFLSAGRRRICWQSRSVTYRNRPVRQIRRTFFTVVPSDNGFDFEVTRQVYY